MPQESDSDDSDNEAVNASNRKTKAQRNKEKRVMEERRKQEGDKLARQRENEVYRCARVCVSAGLGSRLP